MNWYINNAVKLTDSFVSLQNCMIHGHILGILRLSYTTKCNVMLTVYECVQTSGAYVFVSRLRQSHINGKC